MINNINEVKHVVRASSPKDMVWFDLSSPFDLSAVAFSVECRGSRGSEAKMELCCSGFSNYVLEWCDNDEARSREIRQSHCSYSSMVLDRVLAPPSIGFGFGS